MRYYSLVLSVPKLNVSGTPNPNAGLIYQPSATGLGFTYGSGGPTFTSWVQGPYGMQTDPGALNIELNFPSYRFFQSEGRQWIRIWGVGKPMIGQASNLNGANFQLSA